ncbi:MAG: protein translocase subunit SecF [Oscillospiraceae bacterium]|nr:protein translocase subunit SecF [Oscillospiraceae bacterium]
MKIPNFQFMANCKKFFIISAVLAIVILAATAVIGVDLDIQFSGGAIITYSYQGEIEAAEFARMAGELTGVNVSVQQSTDLASGIETLVISLPGAMSLTNDEMVRLDSGLIAAFPENAIQTESITNVSATMGGEFLAKCLVALGFASLLMIIYIAFRFKQIGGLSAGVMSVIGLVHDVLVVFGVHVLFGIPISGNFIAVVLAILGYSINDTIIVYDRIRENKKLFGDKLSLSDLVDRSINQSLRRTVNTTISTVAALAVVAIVAFIFNVDTILTFAFPLMVGLLSGVYSTIFIAGPLWVRWRERASALSA